MTHARELHEEAIRLQEEHARHAREKGDEEIVKLAEERAERARERLGHLDEVASGDEDDAPSA